MTDLKGFVDASMRGEAPPVDWSAHPWSAARPILAWLGIGESPNGPVSREAARLSPSEAELLCDFMMHRFVNPTGELAWSSYMIDEALKSVAESVGGVPEPFLKSLWNFFDGRALDRSVYEFSRAVGRATLGRYARDELWDLRWMLDSPSQAQACLRYWTIGVKPALCSDDLESESMALLGDSPFQF